MSSDLAQIIDEKVRNLPPEKQQEILRMIEAREPAPAPPDGTLWEKVKGFIEQIPPEELDGMPTDASTNIDHYLYEAPKVRKDDQY